MKTTRLGSSFLACFFATRQPARLFGTSKTASPANPANSANPANPANPADPKVWRAEVILPATLQHAFQNRATLKRDAGNNLARWATAAGPEAVPSLGGLSVGQHRCRGVLPALGDKVTLQTLLALLALQALLTLLTLLPS
jgi:hypothetical protein